MTRFNLSILAHVLLLLSLYMLIELFGFPYGGISVIILKQCHIGQEIQGFLPWKTCLQLHQARLFQWPHSCQKKKRENGLLVVEVVGVMLLMQKLPRTICSISHPLQDVNYGIKKSTVGRKMLR